jgi:hypothetical protein
MLTLLESSSQDLIMGTPRKKMRVYIPEYRAEGNASIDAERPTVRVAGKIDVG